jgi:hypothetical protein
LLRFIFAYLLQPIKKAHNLAVTNVSFIYSFTRFNIQYLEYTLTLLLLEGEAPN